MFSLSLSAVLNEGADFRAAGSAGSSTVWKVLASIVAVCVVGGAIGAAVALTTGKRQLT